MEEKKLLEIRNELYYVVNKMSRIKSTDIAKLKEVEDFVLWTFNLLPSELKGINICWIEDMSKPYWWNIKADFVSMK